MRGRPCGFMACWLAAAGLVDSKEAHFDMVQELERDYETRQDYRKSIACRPGGPEFLAHERDSGMGVDVEPEGP